MSVEGSVYITCAADNNFIRFAPTMINSVLNNTQRSVIFGIFTSGVNDQIKASIQAMFPQSTIEFWEIDAEAFRGMPFKSVLSPMVYARALMAEKTGWDKFVYLDLDIAVTGDIGELYDIDIGDNLIGSCIISGGINSGVLVINGEAWRESNTQFEVLKYAAEKQPKEADQASIEAICEGRIYQLPSKWNVIVDPVWGRKSTLRPEYYRDACITHYITGFKPWNLGYWLYQKTSKNAGSNI